MFHFLNLTDRVANAYHLGELENILFCGHTVPSVAGEALELTTSVSARETGARCKIVAKTKKGDPGGSPFLLYNQVVDWLRR